MSLRPPVSPLATRLKARAVPPVVALALAVYGCSESAAGPADESATDAEFGLAATGDPAMPYLAMHRDGGLLIPIVDPSSSDLQGALFVTEEGHEISVTLDDAGLPTLLVVDDLIVVFENVRADAADVAFLLPDGTIQPFLDVPLPAAVAAAVGAPHPVSGGDAFSALTAASFGVDIATCWIGGLVAGVSGVGTAAGIGIVLSCANATLTFIQEALPDEFLAPVTVQTEAGAAVLSLTGCRPSLGGALNCVGTILNLASTAQAANDLTATEASGQVALGRGVLRTGAGEVKFTLTWNNAADLDLWVTDPCGERILWHHRTSESGGELDVDDIDGFGPENIFWLPGTAPNGTYLVEVDHFSGPSPSTWDVFMQRPDDVTHLTGSVSSGQTVVVANYSVASTVSCPVGAPTPASSMEGGAKALP